MSGAWDNSPSSASWATTGKTGRQQGTAREFRSTDGRTTPAPAAPTLSANPWGDGADTTKSTNAWASTASTVQSQKEAPLSENGKKSWWSRSGTSGGGAADPRPRSAERPDTAVHVNAADTVELSKMKEGGDVGKGKEREKAAAARGAGASNSRMVLRALQFLASAAALAFLAAAVPFSKVTAIPYANRSALNLLYVVSGLSAAWSLFCLANASCRKCMNIAKIIRWVLVLCDLFVFVLWVVLASVISSNIQCDATNDQGWCSFFYASVAFAFAAAVLSAISLLWSILGTCCQSRK